MNSKVTYRQQYTRCGKERCRKCKESNGHGPYWYAYWSEKGHTVSKYIGIRLPEHIEFTQERRRNKENNATPAPGKIESAPFTHLSPHVDALETVPLQWESQVMRIYVLGQFRVEHLQQGQWRESTHHIWKRRRARALLGCLLSSPGRRLGREQIMEAIWPDLDTQTAANRLNGAVHELRQILEPEIARPASSSMLRLERDLLLLADRTTIWVDADAFESLVNEAISFDTQNLTPMTLEHITRHLEKADALYSGDYLLEELYSQWAAPRRDALKRGWTGSQLKLSALREAQGSLASAMEPLNRLLTFDPMNETAVQRLMVLLTQLDRRGEALATYRRLAGRLQQYYEGEPLAETQELYEKLRQGLMVNDFPHTITLHKENQASLPTHAEADQLGEADSAETHKQHTAISNDTPSYLRNDVSHAQLTHMHLIAFAGTGQFGRYNQSPLVGREQELRNMRQLLYAIECSPHKTDTLASTSATSAESTHQYESVHPHITLLTGEAGIGKTRLAEELSSEAISRGWAVAWSRAYEQEGSVPYRPWIELLRTLLQHLPIESLAINAHFHGKKETALSQSSFTTLERLSMLLPELRDLLPKNHRSFPQLPPEQERLHLWEATLELLAAMSKIAPLLLVMDDLHWSDGSSRELLAYLIRHFRDQRILLIGTCRDIELAPHDSLRMLITDLRREQSILTLAIQPLSHSQIGSLVSYLPQNIVQSIQAQAGGNPFFAEELARVSDTSLPVSAENEREFPSPSVDVLAISRQQIQDSQIATGSGAMPEGITDVLDRRLDKLSRECQLLLGKVAVLGGAFELNQLLYMANENLEDTMLDLLDEALHAGLLTEEGNGTRIIYHFWHPLIVSHLYERLSVARRSHLHRRAANALISAHMGHELEVAAAITNHLLKGGGEATQIAFYAELAGNQAYNLAAFAEAQQYYAQAISTITGGNLPHKDASYGTDGHSAPLPWHGLRDPIHVARLLERICECAVVQGNYIEARKFYESILALRNLYQRETQPDYKQEAQIQALIWREIGRTWSWNGDYEQAYVCFEHGKQVLRDMDITSGTAWACVHLEQGRISWLQGNYAQARCTTLEALALLEEALHVAAHCSRSNTVSTVSTVLLLQLRAVLNVNKLDRLMIPSRRKLNAPSQVIPWRLGERMNCLA